jgi:hypothetical protein
MPTQFREIDTKIKIQHANPLASHESPRQYQKKTDKMKAKKDIENWKNQDN